MFNDEINVDEARSSLENISPLYRKFVERALNADDPNEIEEIAFAMTGERREMGIIVGLGTGGSKDSLWQRVLDEVYDFLCTNSKTYKDERSKGATHFQSLVAVIASAIGATIHIGIGILTGLVSIALILVAKMGKNAWCKMNATRGKA